MAGLRSKQTDTATTPGRKTHFIFDVPELVQQQQPFSIDRACEEIVPVYDGSSYTSSNIEFVPGSGWQPATIQAQGSNLHETGATVDVLTVPTNYALQPTWAKSTLAGVTYAAAVTSTGDQFYNRLFAASGTLTDGNYNLNSDQTSFPVALGSLTNSPMFRVGLGVSGPMAQRSFAFEVRGNPKSAEDHVAGCYFPGPIGWDLNPNGVVNAGYYYIDFQGDGQWKLLVYTASPSGNHWIIVDGGWYCDPSQVHNVTHRVVITPVAGLYPKVSGGFILFRFTNSGTVITDPGRGSYLTLLSKTPGTSGDMSDRQYKWTAPGIAGNQAVSNYPVRVDSRQDLDVGFQVSTTTNQTAAVLLDQPFQLPFLPDGSTPFKVYFWGNVPSGATLTWDMFEVTAANPPVMTSIGTGGYGDTAAPVASQRFYQMQFLFGGTGTQSGNPVLNGYRIIRDGVGLEVAPGQFETEFQPGPGLLRNNYGLAPTINLADNDPSRANASFTVEDLTGSLPKLQARGDFPTVISTDIPEGGNVIWHRGYARLPDSDQKGNQDGGWYTGLGQGVVEAPDSYLQAYAYDQRFRVDVMCTGMWQRYKEALMPVRFNFAIGQGSSPNDPQPPYVTDAFRQNFYFAGFDDSQLDIPSYDLQLFPTGDADGLVVEPQSSISDLNDRWAKDYFGGYFYPEPNAGPYGKWIFLEQLATPIPPDKFVYSFTSQGPGAMRIPNCLLSYDAVDINGQVMPQAPIFKKNKRWTPKPVEGNYVISYGAAENGGGDSSGLLVMTAYNTESFKFSGFPDAPNPDPNDPDWLSRPLPIWQYLPGYCQSNATDWTSPLVFATRRTFDISCRGRLQQRILAPAVYIFDPKGYFRPVRFYDPVYVDGYPCIVRDVELAYTKDVHQLARYTVERVIDGVPVHPTRVSGVTAMRSAHKRLNVSYWSEVLTSPKNFAIEKRSWGMGAEVLSIGVQRTAPIQNDDGSFVWTLGYDPMG